jgi:tetratricopeptide (TPR) repeat protein
LKHVQSPFHAEAIKFYCILMRANYGMDSAPEADQYFSKALATLDHHWGPFHPLHSTIYGIMAHLLIQRGKMDDAKYLYESSLICSLRVLGPNHIQTAEIHIDFGRLYLRMKKKDEALQHFEEAYLIYESYFGLTALPTANAAMQIATILEEQQGKLNDAYRYVQTATLAFREIYGDESEHTIFA